MLRQSGSGLKLQEKKKVKHKKILQLLSILAQLCSVIERAKIPRMDTFVAIANVPGVCDSLLVDVVDHATKSVATELRRHRESPTR